MSRWFGAALLLVCFTARAEDWKLQLLGCTEQPPEPRPSLAQALELELGPPADSARDTVRVRWPCGDDAVALVSVETAATRLESKVELAAQPEALWDRVLALMARQLLHEARRVAQVTASPTLAPPPDAPAPVPAPSPAAAPAPAPANGSDFGLRAALGARLFPSRPTGLFGGGLEGSWRWARLGLWSEGTRVDLAPARVNAVIVAAQLGAVPFRFRQESWQVGLGAFIEAGWAHSNTAAKLAGYHGTSASAPLGGASVRTELGLRPSPSWAINLALDVGYDIGLRVNVLTVPAVELGGTFVEVHLGVEL